MLEFLIHNAIAIRIRQKLFGWKVAQRHGVEIWFQKIRVYPGYREYDYEPMLERAWMIARNNKKKFPVMRIDHPSYRKFNNELWKTRIQEFLQSL